MKKILSTVILACCTLLAAAQATKEYHGFKGLLNGKTAVELVYSNDRNKSDWIAAGYIYYPNAKTPAPILIVEDWGNEKNVQPKEDNVFKVRLVEYQPDGEMTGIIYLTYSEVEGDWQVLNAQWKNPTTGRVMKFTNIEELNEKPRWYPGEPAVFTAPSRNDWKFLFRLYNEDDEDSEWMNKIRVIFTANDKDDDSLSFTEDLNGSVNSEMEEKLEWINEQDINFDGIPDLLVYLGVTTRAQSLFKAFVWNPVTRQFYEVKEFQDIQEPVIDAKTKTITSYARDVDGLYIDTYKWKNGKLKQIASKKEGIN